MHTNYRLFKWAAGTFTSHRLDSEGVWLSKVEHLGKAECVGEFDSPDVARDKALERLTGDRYAIYLVCDADFTIVHHVSDRAAQDELQRQRERGDDRAKIVIVFIVALISCLLLWSFGVLTLSSSGIAIALAIPAACYLLSMTFNPVETAVALAIPLILLALTLAVDANVKKRVAAKRGAHALPVGRQ